MTSYGLTDLCNEIGLTGETRALKYIYDNAASLLRKWAKIRPGITNASQNKYKGITPYPVSNITTDYAHEWPVDFTPESDNAGPIKALSQFVDLVNDLAYDHTLWSPCTTFEVVVLSNTGTELETNQVYNGAIDVHGNTYRHKIRCRINLSHPDAEHIGLEDVLGSTGKMAVWAVPSGSGQWKRRLNPAILSAVGGGVFDLDIATETWEADTYTIYPLFVNGSQENNNYSFPSASVGVGSIQVLDIPDYPYIPLTGMIIREANAQGQDVSQQILHIPFTTGSFQLFGQIVPNNATDITIGWASRSPGIISVDSNGLCTFLAPGQATIDVTGYQHYYAQMNSKTNWVILDCGVILYISISPTAVEMGTGNHTSAQVTGSVSPDIAINRRIEYTSSDSSKVSVQSGASSVESDIPITIYAVAVGSANIVAKAWGDQSKTATCVVNVRQGCTGIAITEASLILYTTSDPVTLHTNVQPNNAYNKAVSYSSSNTSVATVDANGKVTPVGVGTCTITGTTRDTYYSAQQYSDTVSVEVKNPATTVVDIQISGYSGGVQVGQSVTLKILAVYADSHTADVTYANGWSGYTSIFSLSGVGTFTGIAEGNATLTATYMGFTTSIPVSVYIVHVSSVSLNKTSTTILIGGTDQLTATVLPANANNKAVTWSSNNTSKATVSNTGLITGVGVGSATITVTTQDGGKTATCTVTVNPIPVTGVSLNTSGQTISIGDTYQLVATVSPSNATDKAVTWSSSNNSVVTVTSNGLVTAVGAGSATITVTTHDGGFTATCYISVPNPAPVMTGIGIRGYNGAVNKGSSVTLQIVTTWSDGHEEDVTYANGWSGYTSIFSLSGVGTFTGIAGGSAILTATYGGYTTSIPVTCNVPVSGISIDKTTIMLAPGASTTIKGTISPSDASNKGVNWRRQNTNVSLSSSSSVSGNNITLTAGSNTGTCVITATAAGDNTKTVTCLVTISSSVAVQSVTILGDDVIYTGNTGALMTADYYPSNASLASTGAFAWTCDDSRVLVGNPSSQTCRVRCSTELRTTLRVTVTDSQGNTATDSMTIIFSNEPI